MNKDGGQAFPQQRGDLDSGMTLRDYFAGQALSSQKFNYLDDIHREMLSRQCYALADAMIAERSKSC